MPAPNANSVCSCTSPGGYSHLKGAGMPVRKGEGDQPGHGPTFFLPLKGTILLQCSLGIDVIKNFDYNDKLSKINKTHLQNMLHLHVQP